MCQALSERKPEAKDVRQQLLPIPLPGSCLLVVLMILYGYLPRGLENGSASNLKYNTNRTNNNCK